MVPAFNPNAISLNIFFETTQTSFLKLKLKTDEKPTLDSHPNYYSLSDPHEKQGEHRKPESNPRHIVESELVSSLDSYEAVDFFTPEADGGRIDLRVSGKGIRLGRNA